MQDERRIKIVDSIVNELRSSLTTISARVDSLLNDHFNITSIVDLLGDFKSAHEFVVGSFEKLLEQYYNQDLSTEPASELLAHYRHLTHATVFDKELQDFSSMSVKSKLLYAISRELREGMTATTMGLELLISDIKDEKQIRIIEDITDANEIASSSFVLLFFYILPHSLKANDFVSSTTLPAWSFFGGCLQPFRIQANDMGIAMGWVLPDERTLDCGIVVSKRMMNNAVHYAIKHALSILLPYTSAENYTTGEITVSMSIQQKQERVPEFSGISNSMARIPSPEVIVANELAEEAAALAGEARPQSQTQSPSWVRNAFSRILQFTSVSPPSTWKGASGRVVVSAEATALETAVTSTGEKPRSTDAGKIQMILRVESGISDLSFSVHTAGVFEGEKATSVKTVAEGEIGLWIARSVIELYDGSIAVSSYKSDVGLDSLEYVCELPCVNMVAVKEAEDARRRIERAARLVMTRQGGGEVRPPVSTNRHISTHTPRESPTMLSRLTGRIFGEIRRREGGNENATERRRLHGAISLTSVRPMPDHPAAAAVAAGEEEKIIPEPQTPQTLPTPHMPGGKLNKRTFGNRIFGVRP